MAVSRKQLLKNVTSGSDQAKNATATRDMRILLALDAGCSLRQVAEAADLSPARIHQIKHGK